jgi:hypothetical protein
VKLAANSIIDAQTWASYIGTKDMKYLWITAKFRLNIYLTHTPQLGQMENHIER